MTAPGDSELRRALHGMLEDLPPSPAPLDAITRRAKGVRLRRAGAAAVGLALAGIVAVTVLAPPGSRQPTGQAMAPAGPPAPGGVFAQGIADGRAWRLSAQDIADPGYACQPAVVLNGTDADPVYPHPGNLAAVALGSSVSSVPGTGFGFVQLPAGVNAISVNGSDVQAVNAVACGLGYHVAGFAYSLAHAPRVTVASPPPGWPGVLTMPQVSTRASANSITAEPAGLWINTYLGGGGALPGALETELVFGPDWSLQIQFGTGGDCYLFSAGGSLGTQMGTCGPVSTPQGPETIMALPAASSSHRATALTGYAVQVSPATAGLEATLSNGSSEQAAFCVVDGRKYAAFAVPSPLRLSRLTWLDARGRVIATTTELPRRGYVQFQP